MSEQTERNSSGPTREDRWCATPAYRPRWSGFYDAYGHFAVLLLMSSCDRAIRRGWSWVAGYVSPVLRPPALQAGLVRESEPLAQWPWVSALIYALECIPLPFRRESFGPTRAWGETFADASLSRLVAGCHAGSAWSLCVRCEGGVGR